jgi:hypothetical protein
MAYDGFDGYMWDLWFNLRMKEAGLDFHTCEREEWHKVLNEMPAAYTIDVSVSEQKVTFEHCDGTDTYPLTEFFGEDNGPKVELLKKGAYWDGPITGTCMFNGVEAYFEMTDEGDLDRNRKYAAYKLMGKEHGDKLGEFYWFDFSHYQKPRTC